MGDDIADPLLLGQRVVAILETGLRTATYKLATLMALIDHCIENMPERPDDVLSVPDSRSGTSGVGDLLATGASIPRPGIAPIPQPRAGS